MKRLYYYICFSLAQILLCLIIGYIAMNMAVPSDTVRNGVSFSGVDFSGARLAKAAESIGKIGKRQIDGGIAWSSPIFVQGG